MFWPKFICLVGIDGSGKTTLAKAFVKFAKEKGVDYHYVWANNQPIFLGICRLFSRAIFFRGKGMFENYSEYVNRKKSLAKNKNIYRIYKLLHTIDYYIWIFVKVKLPLFMGRRLICDRYVYDVAINLGLLSDLNFEQINELIQQYFRYMPVPEKVFFLDVPLETALQRKDDIPSITYLIARRDKYSLLSDHYGFITINGTGKIDSIISEMFNQLNK